MRDYYLGLMSGTSLDGIDAAIVDLSAPFPTVLAAHTRPFTATLRQAVLDLAHGQAPHEIELLGTLDTRLGEQFAQAVLTLLEHSGIPTTAIRAIGSHGQTVRHRPRGPEPFTLQIGDPNIIAERTGITTVADFRRRDIAAGGQGAPLVPAFHAMCFRNADEDRAVLNLGGMANLTILPADPQTPVSGLDTGPGNVLLDAWIDTHQRKSFDAEGAWAAHGTVIPALLDTLMTDEFFQQPPPKSTGREQFHLGWLEQHLHGTSYAPVDVQATLCALTARSVANAMTTWAPSTKRVLVCGGGAHNTHLLELLRRHLPGTTIESTAVHGLDPDWIEAAAFAWMARETLAGRTANLPSVTGARHPVIMGGIYLAASTQLR
ncbi:MAG: anhydro-N-acetylmuramic acid kinase [Gammaproteobacteria bacterium]|nr:anhydro-N-acetylmuramic acid kinase [Gammaproteobacteria bacterium]